MMMMETGSTVYLPENNRSVMLTGTDHSRYSKPLTHHRSAASEAQRSDAQSEEHQHTRLRYSNSAGRTTLNGPYSRRRREAACARDRLVAHEEIIDSHRRYGIGKSKNEAVGDSRTWRHAAHGVAAIFTRRCPETNIDVADTARIVRVYAGAGEHWIGVVGQSRQDQVGARPKPDTGNRRVDAVGAGIRDGEIEHIRRKIGSGVRPVLNASQRKGRGAAQSADRFAIREFIV